MTQNSWSRHIGLAAGIALIAIVLSSTSAGPAIAETFKPVMSFIVNDVTSPVPVRAVASNLTHVGQPVNDLVHLRWFNGSDRQCFIRSGDSTATCYAPETGRTLVVTDVSWYFQKSSSPGRVGQFVLFSSTGFDYETFASTTDGLTFVGSDHFHTGFVYRPDLRSRWTISATFSGSSCSCTGISYQVSSALHTCPVPDLESARAAAAAAIFL